MIKKILFLTLILLAFSLNCFANCPTTDEKCDKCTVEDDEYCIYNECYFDKQYRKLKVNLCLDEVQEAKLDNIYKIYKLDMEALCAKYKEEKNKILALIACDNPNWKHLTKNLDKLKEDIKIRYLCFEDDIKELLTKCQYAEFKQFKKAQREKIKLIVKYGAVYKFPCENCGE